MREKGTKGTLSFSRSVAQSHRHLLGPFFSFSLFLFYFFFFVLCEENNLEMLSGFIAPRFEGLKRVDGVMAGRTLIKPYSGLLFFFLK